MRPFLEFDFDLYKTGLSKYVQSMKRLYCVNHKLASDAEPNIKQYLYLDNRVLFETVLFTENVLEKVIQPRSETDYSAELLEMYGCTATHKIILTSAQPRYYAK